MQLAHFSFGIGAFISPFIVEPFLREISSSELGKSPGTPLNTTSSDDVLQSPLNIDPSTLRIKWAFFITGGVNLLIWLTFVITWWKKPDNKPHESREAHESPRDCAKAKEPNKIVEGPVTLETIKQQSLEMQPLYGVRKYRGYHKVVIVLLAAMFLHLSYGLELSFGVMLASYARFSGLALDKSRASFVTS